MKYSFMSFSTPALSLPEMLAAAKRYGYDGIEPRLDGKHAHGVEVGTTGGQRALIRRQADEAGVAIACLATSLKYADPARTEEALRQTHERIDLAADVGASVVRVFGGQMPDGLSRGDAIGVVAKSLSSAAAHAADRGVTLCLETHDAWCDPAHVAEVMRRVDSPSVGVNWDILHPVRQALATLDESFETLRPWIRHLHIHDGTGKGIEMTPIGQGIIDHRRLLELLRQIDFAGYLSGEWINWEPWEIHLPREIATLRRYEKKLA